MDPVECLSPRDELENNWSENGFWKFINDWISQALDTHCLVPSIDTRRACQGCPRHGVDHHYARISRLGRKQTFSPSQVGWSCLVYRYTKTKQQPESLLT